MLYEKFPDLKFKYRKQGILVPRLLCRYGRQKCIKDYISRQLSEDKAGVQLTMMGTL